MEEKRTLVEECKRKLAEKMNAIQSALQELAESIGTETKSSAGDKHETARARMQFEQEKLGLQLDALRKQAEELGRFDLLKTNGHIGAGSLVETDKGIFLISIPLGKLSLRDREVYAVSAISPLAIAMKGLRKGGAFDFNGIRYRITRVV